MNITRLRPLKSAATGSFTSNKSASETGKVGVKPEASTLLVEVLAYLHGIELPIVQFLPACVNGSGEHVSREFAAAAAARLGRTLLLDAGTNFAPQERTPINRGAGRRQRRTSATMPDSDVPGLYHRQAVDAALELIATETPDAQPFRLMVVQSAAPVLSPGSLDRSRHCHGSILTVAAGLTRLPDLQATARQVRQAGGTLLGTVLFDAPTTKLSFNTYGTLWCS